MILESEDNDSRINLPNPRTNSGFRRIDSRIRIKMSESESKYGAQVGIKMMIPQNQNVDYGTIT